MVHWPTGAAEQALIPFAIYCATVFLLLFPLVVAFSICTQLAPSVGQPVPTLMPVTVVLLEPQPPPLTVMVAPPDVLVTVSVVVGTVASLVLWNTVFTGFVPSTAVVEPMLLLHSL